MHQVAEAAAFLSESNLPARKSASGALATVYNLTNGMSAVGAPAAAAAVNPPDLMEDSVPGSAPARRGCCSSFRILPSGQGRAPVVIQLAKLQLAKAAVLSSVSIWLAGKSANGAPAAYTEVLLRILP